MKAWHANVVAALLKGFMKAAWPEGVANHLEAYGLVALVLKVAFEELCALSDWVLPIPRSAWGELLAHMEAAGALSPLEKTLTHEILALDAIQASARAGLIEAISIAGDCLIYREWGFITIEVVYDEATSAPWAEPDIKFYVAETAADWRLAWSFARLLAANRGHILNTQDEATDLTGACILVGSGAARTAYQARVAIEGRGSTRHLVRQSIDGKPDCVSIALPREAA